MPTDSPKYNIICLSNQLWDFPLWTNKRHVMMRLPKLGHDVLFVDPPINVGKVFFKYFMAKKWSLTRILTGVKHAKEEGLTIFSPLNPLPFGDFSKKHAQKINSIAQKAFTEKGRKTILWVYHVEMPGLENYLKNIKHDFLVYDCVDNYEGFPKYDTELKKDFIAKQEKELTTRANIVFATTPGLVEKLKKFNPNTFFTPNVGDYNRYVEIKNRITRIPEDMLNIPQPIIGFTGAIDQYKFDKTLFAKVVHDYPSYSFVIIGPMALKDTQASFKDLGVEDAKNVYLLGTKDYTVLPEYISHFDVMIIPYVLNNYTVGGCFPVKFLDYLAAGLPVVVTDLPTYTPFQEASYVSKNPNEFSQNIRRAIEDNSEDKIRAREIEASRNTWEGKVSTMLSLISDHIRK